MSEPLSNAPPDWFLGFMSEVCGLYPSWSCTETTIAAYWRHLHMISADALARALSEHVASSKFAPSVAELRAGSLAPCQLGKTAAEAWDEMRRNRKLYSPYADHETNEARVKWSSVAVRRAAEAVCWTDLTWASEQLPTIRAQFERYYNALKGKRDLIERKIEAAETTQRIGGMLGLNDLVQLYGADYRDPLPEKTHAEEWDAKDPEWRESADIEPGDDA